LNGSNNPIISTVSNTVRVINSVDSSPFTARLNSSEDNLLHSPRAQLEDSLFMPSIVYCPIFPSIQAQGQCYHWPVSKMNVLVPCLTSYKPKDNQTVVILTLESNPTPPLDPGEKLMTMLTPVTKSCYFRWMK